MDQVELPEYKRLPIDHPCYYAYRELLNYRGRVEEMVSNWGYGFEELCLMIDREVEIYDERQHRLVAATIVEFWGSKSWGDWAGEPTFRIRTHEECPTLTYAQVSALHFPKSVAAA